MPARRTAPRDRKELASCSFLTAAILLLVAVAAAPASGETPGLAARLDRAAAESRWDDALAIADTLSSERHEAYLASLQRIVGLQCRKGDLEAAYDAIDELLAAGCWDFRALREDPELALISGQERFRTAVRGAWSQQYIGMLERESRAGMQMPDRIMATLALREGERVADVGAGSGYFTLPVAAAVGPTGKVWATDIRQEMLDHIAGRLREAGLNNVELALVTPDDPQLPPGGVDTILMVDVFHYIRERTAYGRKLRDALAPGGRLVVIDFRYDPDAVREFAPPPEQQVARETLDADLAAAGFRVREAHDFLPEQYFVVYEAR